MVGYQKSYTVHQAGQWSPIYNRCIQRSAADCHIIVAWPVC